MVQPTSVILHTRVSIILSTVYLQYSPTAITSLEFHRDASLEVTSTNQCFNEPRVALDAEKQYPQFEDLDSDSDNRHGTGAKKNATFGWVTGSRCSVLPKGVYWIGGVIIDDIRSSSSHQSLASDSLFWCRMNPLERPFLVDTGFVLMLPLLFFFFFFFFGMVISCACNARLRWMLIPPLDRQSPAEFGHGYEILQQVCGTYVSRKFESYP